MRLPVSFRVIPLAKFPKVFFKNNNILLLLLVVFGQVMAQDYDNFFYGKLIDATTGEPLVFATVRVKGKALGVISNNDGGFKIPLDFQLKGDSLAISIMGYKTKGIAFDVLKKKTINQIMLEQYTFELSETVVTAKRRRSLGKVKKSLTAEQIVKYAIERIADNYDNSPFGLVGYYRDYQLREKEYINLNEALIKVFDKGFDEDHTNVQFGLYNYKANLDFKVDSFAAKPYDYQSKDKYIPHASFTNDIVRVTNELMLLFNHDAIRHNDQQAYSFVDVFIKDFIKNHEFYTYFITNYHDKKVYKVKFAKKLAHFEVKGDIYIDSDTYAIRKMDYGVFMQKSDATSESNQSPSEMELLYDILVEYQDYENYMYLNYISFHNKFKLKRPPKFFLKDVVQVLHTKELLIVLNKPAKNWYSLKPKDLKVYYGEERLRVDGLTQIDAATYKFKFSKKGKSKRKKLRHFFRESGTKKRKPTTVEINNMVDLDGNVLGEENSEVLDQFREFFTQKVVTKATNETYGSVIIDKETSLGHPDQPRIKAEMNEDLWMNTPLKSKL